MRLACLVRPCCSWTQQNRATQRDSDAVLYCDWQWGNYDLCTTYIDLTNFCHFLRNNDSKYCFFSCKRCSLRLKRGHLFTFRATFIFLHRASKALSRAANSFMLVSWSRLLRNIHSEDIRYRRGVHPSLPLYKCVIDLTPVIAMVVCSTTTCFVTLF